MSTPHRGRSGVGTGDLVIGLAVLAIALALLYPTLRSRGVRAGFEAAIADVEAARRGAEAHFGQRGAWPASAPAGLLPPELAVAFPSDSTLARATYTLQWVTWDVVDEVAIVTPQVGTTDARPDSVRPTMTPLVRRVGSILVHSREEALLAELLRRYAAEGAFVRDTTWTLVLPRRQFGGD